MTTVVVWLLIESLSNNDDDSSKLFFLKKWPHTISKFIPSYSMSFNLSNIGQVFWIWILKDWLSLKMNEQENRCLVITSSTKHEINEEVPCCDHVTMATKCTKKHVARCKCCFVNLNLLPFCHSCWCCQPFCLTSLWLLNIEVVKRGTGDLVQHRQLWVAEVWID